MKKKKSLLHYADLIHTVGQLPAEKQGDLFMHILRYVNDENPTTTDPLVKLAFEPIKQQLKRDLVKWKDISDKRRKAALDRWNKQDNANADKSMQEPYGNDTVNDTVNVNDIVTYIIQQTKKDYTDYYYLSEKGYQDLVDEFRVNKLDNEYRVGLHGEFVNLEALLKEKKKHFSNWVNLKNLPKRSEIKDPKRTSRLGLG